MNNSTNNGASLHLPTQLDAGELDPLAVECAAQRAEIRGRFTSAIERARTWDLPKVTVR